MSNRFLAFLSLVVLFPTLALHPGQAVGAQQLSTQVPDESDVGQSECSQPALEQNALIRDAETDKYTTRRVEFVGNKYTRDMVLRRRIKLKDQYDPRNHMKPHEMNILVRVISRDFVDRSTASLLRSLKQ